MPRVSLYRPSTIWSQDRPRGFGGPMRMERIMKRMFMTVMGALLILLGALVQPAAAQTSCGARQDVADKLKRGYDEQPSALGLAHNGTVVEVFTSPTGTWTIILTRPDGVSCLMATGESWQAMAQEIAELES